MRFLSKKAIRFMIQSINFTNSIKSILMNKSMVDLNSFQKNTYSQNGKALEKTVKVKFNFSEFSLKN